MVPSRRENGGHGACHSARVAANPGALLDGRVRRQVSSSFLRRRSRDLNPDNSAVDARTPGLDSTRSTGRPMPELFGVQNLRELTYSLTS